MATAAEQQSRILEGELTCPVCLDVFNDPHMLPCSHNFCLACVRSIKRQSNRSRFRCPECRESHRCSVEPLKNLKLANIASNFRKKARETTKDQAAPAEGLLQLPAAASGAVVPCDFCPPPSWRESRGETEEAGPSDAPVAKTDAVAVKTCLKCELSMCAEHVKPHLELLAFRDHQLTEPLADLKRRKCPEHDEMYRYYCMDDKVCVCNACTIEGHHSGHTIKTLKNTMKDLKRSVENHLHKVESKLTKADRTIQKIKEEERQIKKLEDDTEQCVATLGDMLRRAVDDFLASLRQCTRTHCSTITPNMQRSLCKVAQDQTRLQELRRSFEVLLQENDPFRFLEVHGSSTKRYRSLLKRPLYSPDYLPVDTTALGGNMDDALEEHMTVVRDYVNGAIDSLCPLALRSSSPHSAGPFSGSEEDENSSEYGDNEEEMPSEEDDDDDDDDDDEEEEEAEEELYTESADGTYNPENEEELEEEEEEEEEGETGEEEEGSEAY